MSKIIAFLGTLLMVFAFALPANAADGDGLSTINSTVPGSGGCTAVTTAWASVTMGSQAGKTAKVGIRHYFCGSTHYLNGIAYQIIRGTDQNCSNELGDHIVNFTFNATSIAGWNPPAVTMACTQGTTTKVVTSGINLKGKSDLCTNATYTVHWKLNPDPSKTTPTVCIS